MPARSVEQNGDDENRGVELHQVASDNSPPPDATTSSVDRSNSADTCTSRGEKTMFSFSSLEVADDEINAEIEAARGETMVDENIHYPLEETIHLTFFSRLSERLRFTLSPELLLTDVTLDGFTAELKKAEGLGPEASCSWEPKLQQVWDSYQHCLDKKHKQELAAAEGGRGGRRASVVHSSTVTYGDLLNLQFPHYPETTKEERHILTSLANHRPVISKQDIITALEIEDTEDSELLEYVFASGATVLPTEVFRAIINSLSVSPKFVSFAPAFVDQVVSISSRGTPMLTNFVILILIMALTPWIGHISQHTAYQAGLGMFDNDWSNGCPNGPEKQCHFIRRNLGLTKFPGTEVLRFAREEVIYRLWPASGERAMDHLFGSSQLFGALQIRHAPLRHAFDSNVAKEQCKKANVSTTTFHMPTTSYFGCDYFWALTVPFSYTQEEALAVTQAANISTPWPQSTALLFDFATFQRSTGMIVHTRGTIALPNGGTASARVDVSPIDPRVPNRVLPIFIFQTVTFVIDFVSALTLKLRGVPAFGMNFFMALTMFALCTTSYILLSVASPLSNAEALAGQVYQADFLPEGIDRMAEQYNNGMTVLGFYALFFMIFLGRFLDDIAGLELVIAVLKMCAVELVSLAFMFTFWTMGFTTVAMTLFGQTIPSFSSFANAFIALLDYFKGNDNFGEFEEQHAITGPIFFFVYQLYVILFALNLLIAVLTAPLTEVKRESVLDVELLQQIEEELIVKAPGSTKWHVLKWELYSRYWLPLCGFFWHARPIGSGFWLKARVALEQLYTSQETEPLLDSSLYLLSILENCQDKMEAWNSPLLRFTVKNKLIQGNVSLALVLGLCMAESDFASVRDSELLLAVTRYSRWFANLKLVQDNQDFLKEIAAGQTKNLDRKLAAAMKDANRALEALDGKDATAVDEALDRVGSIDLTNQSPTAPPGHAGVEFTTEESPTSAASPDQLISGGGGAPRNAWAPGDPYSPDRTEGGSARGRVYSTAGGNGPELETVSQFSESASAVSFSAMISSGNRYHFSDIVQTELTTSKWSLLRAAIVSVFTIWLVVAFFIAEEPAAYLSRSLEQGLRYGWHTQRCLDPACKAAQSWEKVYGDNVYLADWYDYMNNVVKPRVFRRRRLNISDALFPELDGVDWDPRIVRIRPVIIRQLRASPKGCEDFPTSSADLASTIAFFQRTPCSTGIGPGKDFDKLDIPIPATGIPSRMNAQSYKFQEECKGYGATFLGSYTSYPCSGHVVEVNDSVTLQQVLDSGWIDNSARLIEVSSTFAMGNSVVSFSLFTELGEHGQGISGRTLAVPVSSSDALDLSFPQRIIFHILLGLDLVIAFLLYIRYQYKLRVKHIDPEEAKKIEPRIPVGSILILATLLLFYIIFRGDEATRAISVLVLTFAFGETTIHVVFPGAAMISKPLKVLIDTLTHAAFHCLYVIPFLILFIVSFSYAGMLLFGRGVTQYAEPRTAFTSTILATFGLSESVVDIDQMTNFRPLASQIYLILFFAAILIVLANMFLSMVTSASADAQQTPPSILVAENVQFFYGRSPKYGVWARAYLAVAIAWTKAKLNIKILRRILPKKILKKRCPDPVILTPWGRLWFTSECLVPRLRPMRISFLLKQYNYDYLHISAFAVLVPHLIQRFLDFKEQNQVEYASDEADNAAFVTLFVKRVAENYYAEKLRERRRKMDLDELDDHDDETNGASPMPTAVRNNTGNGSRHPAEVPSATAEHSREGKQL